MCDWEMFENVICPIFRWFLNATVVHVAKIILMVKFCAQPRKYL